MKKILVTQEEKHNKFWIGEVKGTTLHTKWGRIGTIGQQKSYKKSSKYDAERMLDKKFREKYNKGYDENTLEQFKEKTIIAKIIGTANKMDYFWVELDLKKKKFWKKAEAERLQQPDCEPGLMIDMQTRKWGEIKLIVSNNGCYDENGNTIREGHHWWEIAEKAHEAIASV